MNPRSSAFFIALSLPLVAPAHAEEKAMAPVWKISDADSTVYLAGSVHLLREKDLPIPPAFDRVYAEAEEIVFEIDMATMMRPETAAEMRKLGSLPQGETLSDRFGEETIQRLGDYLKDRGMREDFFETYAPGMVFLLLSSFEATRLGARPELGLESTYYAKSVEDGIPSRGLETIAFQISRLNGFENTMVEELINDALDETADSGKTLDEITAAWKAGKADELAEVIGEEESFSPELREVLLIERNRNWIPEIEKALATEHDVMFLVGAAHLVGEGSVVDLLREKGLEVTQLEAGKR
jgi:uncharacterized protein YbaP (TraB family)